MNFIRWTRDFILYSHIFIVVCALAAVYLNNFYHPQESHIGYEYYLFIASGTFIIYNVHRLLSVIKIAERGFELKGRYIIISNLKPWYYLSSALALPACAFAYLKLDTSIQALLMLPAVVAVLYVSPIFPSHKRLRDYNFLKIFMIAFCWAWLCTYIPLRLQGLPFKEVLGIEKFFFILAITLPFDFRDLDLDTRQTVKTLVSYLGYKRSMALAILLLFSSLIIMWIVTMYLSVVEEVVFYGMLLAYFIISPLLAKAFKPHSDYYYTFLIDGSFLILSSCVVLVNYMMS